MVAIWQDETEDEMNEAFNNVLEKLNPNNTLLADICQKYTNDYYYKRQAADSELCIVFYWSGESNPFSSSSLEQYKTQANFYIE